MEYKSGCPCFRSISGCREHCSCIGCKNPYGIRSNQSINLQSWNLVHRERRLHNSTKMPSGKSFLSNNNSGVLPEIWSRIEELVLHEISNFFGDEITVNDGFLYEFYQRIVSTEKGRLLKLRAKSLVSINKKIKSLTEEGLLCRKLILEQGKICLRK